MNILDNVKTMEYLGIIMVRPWRVQYKGEIFDVGLSAVTKAAVCINEQMKTQKELKKKIDMIFQGLTQLSIHSMASILWLNERPSVLPSKE